MLKKSALTLFGLIFAVALIAPPKATAQIHVGVQFGGPSYGYVVQPRPYYAYDDTYVVYAPNGGYRDGYYDRDYRRHDDREDRGREGWEHHDNWNHDRGNRNWDNHDRGDRDRGHHDHGER